MNYRNYETETGFSLGKTPLDRLFEKSIISQYFEYIQVRDIEVRLYFIGKKVFDYTVMLTVLVLIKLTKFAVALRLRCGSC